jgi:DNA polymerase-3 subunit delta'
MNITGHTKILNLLNKAIDKGAVSHAYLFFGVENLGKFTLAQEFSKRLTGFADSVINSNLIIVQPEVIEKKGIIKKLDIKVENVREIQRKLSLSSSGQGRIVAIINEADRLTKAAQNSLLKTLEEPPQGVVIILVTNNKEKLLPTVLSRCQTLRFNSLSDDEMEEVIALNTKNRDSIIFWSMGRPGLAKKILGDTDELARREESVKELKILLGKSINEKFSLAESMSKNVPLALEKLDWWVMLLRKSMIEKKREKVEGEINLIEKISNSMKVIKSANANVRLVLENLFLDF